MNVNLISTPRRISRTRKVLRVLIPLSMMLILGIITGVFLYRDYPNVRNQARAEENVFWAKSNRLSQEDRSALLNYVVHTNTVPHVLPWWEQDRNMCSAVVVKFISLFTGIKFFHTSAWEFRTLRPHPCKNCVANQRKLTTIWDATEDFDENGQLPKGLKEEYIEQVLSLPFEDDKIYVIGLLWENTVWWNTIQETGADVNSHLALIVRGKLIHFYHLGDDHPMRMETLADVFARKDMKPVWVAEVHEKSHASAPDWILKSQEYRFAKTNRELAFTQNVWPWQSLRKFLRFPAEPNFVPTAWHGIFAKADTLIEKTLLMHYRNGYDPYPTAFQEVEK